MKQKFFCVFAAIVCILCSFTAYARAGEVKIRFFNAGKADACLIQTPNSNILIDTGKNKFGKDLVTRLQKEGIDTIDVLVITHFDKDHVGGADQVLEKMNVRQIYEPSYKSDSKQYQQYQEAVQLSGASVHTLEQNIAFELDGVSYVIDVANRSFYGDNEENDFSLVMEVRHDNNTFLFAGDAENPRLGELLNEEIGQYDVLKVPHHGRAEQLSAAFFEAVSPQFSVITSDEEEMEEDQVVWLLEQYGSVLLTRLGDITFISDGESLRVEQ